MSWKGYGGSKALMSRASDNSHRQKDLDRGRGERGWNVNTLRAYRRRNILDTNCDPYWSSVDFLGIFDGTDEQVSGYNTEDDNAFNTTFVGTTLQDTVTPFEESTTSLFFPTGNDTYLQTQVGVGTAANLAANAWTLEGWYYFTTDPGTSGDTLMSKWGADGDRCWRMGVTSSSELYIVYTGDGSTNLGVHNTPKAYSTGQWYHIAITCDDSGNIRFYTDGVQLGSAVSRVGTIHSDSTPPIQIGAYVGGAGRFLDGYASNVRITNGVARYTDSAYTVPTAAFPTVACT